ncbi:MAG: undecaprenyl-diphosphate phosphatase [Oscillospiraceae bacterium]|nr:undecaprenyl-diphosphate phosphatase [Oscillospiraceae bacterium]
MSILMSLLLGLVQGITEFLPISSSGHLSILQNIFRLNYVEENHLLFEVLLHLGTLVSIIYVYREDLKTMLAEGLAFLRMRSDADLDEPVVLRPPARALLFVIIGTMPMVIALFFMKSVKRLFFRLGFIGFALIVTGGLLFASDRFITKGNKTERTMTLWDALVIGCSQAVAIVPGLSRSGTTIAVGLACGLSGNYAVKYSLLLSIPAVFGATIASLYTAIRDGMNISLLLPYLLGSIVATVTGFFAIQLIRRLMNKGDFGKFAYYCWGAGLVTIIVSFFR